MKKSKGTLKGGIFLNEKHSITILEFKIIINNSGKEEEMVFPSIADFRISTAFLVNNFTRSVKSYKNSLFLESFFSQCILTKERKVRKRR